ncbi:ABC transporter ATP-binding protein [Amphibacillus cookii]|uniref:ABC transporter ATP-binding protein n=1 Tax=Amphibacillus cookii TaxID=767787 RepID=UPI0019573B8B|nr:ABC transporter ATP-binding protein [Amphibacillus cookii]MBM7542133.1 ABC-2 type transport system ATP-binding protein [Amphibacillus cookii]
MDLIKATQLTKSFKEHQVIKCLNVKIEKGKTIALIGPNGAGKSTTIGLLLGLIPPTSGTINHWCEHFKEKVGVQLQATPFFEGFTVEENLQLFASFYHIKLDQVKLEEKLKAFDLLAMRKKNATHLSIGQQKRLAIAVTTLHNPELVILDEPTAGLDPQAQKKIRDMLLELKGKGMTIMFSSHDMAEVTKIADVVIFLSQGEIIAQGAPADLLHAHNVDHLEALFFQLI